jgi:hypothetical protein
MRKSKEKSTYSSGKAQKTEPGGVFIDVLSSGFRKRMGQEIKNYRLLPTPHQFSPVAGLDVTV